jgi:hypothetical protein
MAKGNIQAFNPYRVVGAVSKVIFVGDGVLGGVFCSAGTTPTLTLYDGVDATGTLLVNAMPLTPGQWTPLPFGISKGVFVTIGGTTPDVTIGFLP